MDIQRYALMIALALVGWMTLVEWNSFRLEHAPQAAAEQSAPTSPASASTPVQDPASPKTLPSSAEIPALQAPQAAAAPTTATPESGTIRVNTDTLIVDISLTGGDIVGVSLPKFHRELGRHDLHFRLLQQSTERNYTAQSGLVGPDGTDTAKERPVFSSANSAWSLPDGEKTLVVTLEHTTNAGVRILKRYTFTRGSYLSTVYSSVDR